MEELKLGEDGLIKIEIEEKPYYNLLCWDTIKCNCGYGSYFVLSFWRTWRLDRNGI